MKELLRKMEVYEDAIDAVKKGDAPDVLYALIASEY